MRVIPQLETPQRAHRMPSVLVFGPIPRPVRVCTDPACHSTRPWVGGNPCHLPLAFHSTRLCGEGNAVSLPQNPAADAPFRCRTALDRGCRTRKRRFRSMNPRPARRFPLQYGRNRAKPPRSERLALPKHGSAPFCVSFLNFNRACHSTTRLPAGRVVALPRRKRLDLLVGRPGRTAGGAAVPLSRRDPMNCPPPCARRSLPPGSPCPVSSGEACLIELQTPVASSQPRFALAVRAARSRPARNPLPIFWPKDSHPCARGN